MCDICGEGFSIYSNMIRHKRVRFTVFTKNFLDRELKCIVHSVDLSCAKWAVQVQLLHSLLFDYPRLCKTHGTCPWGI